MIEGGGQTKDLWERVDAPTGPTRSVVSDVRNRRKHGRSWGVCLFTGGAEGARDLSYPLTIGMEDSFLILSRFFVQVIDKGHPKAAGGYAEGSVLESLEFLSKGW